MSDRGSWIPQIGDRVRSAGGYDGTVEAPEPGDERICVRFDDNPNVVLFVDVAILEPITRCYIEGGVMWSWGPLKESTGQQPLRFLLSEPKR